MLRTFTRLFSLSAMCFMATAATAQDWVPDELRGWEDWVLKDREYRDCPLRFDSRASERSDFQCVWADTLDLDADASGARFSQGWSVSADSQWVTLPGDARHWPDNVRANGQPVEVVARDGRPAVRLDSGNWRLTGQFAWDERPGVLQLPSPTGLVVLTVDGAKVARPDINQSRLFLGERVQEDAREVDSVRTAVYRLVVDDVPTHLVTELQIDVSGSVREEAFGSVLPDGFVPVLLDSELPAKLEADGTLRLQVRPGRWTVYLAARGGGVVDNIQRPPQSDNMPSQEIWSFEASSELRVAAVEGLPPVDPMQVDVPDDWLDYPAYRVDADTVFSVAEKSRGVVSAVNDLVLNRTLWLDFNGEGYTFEDSLSGEMRTDWRLDMGGIFSVLSATENGDNLLITNGATNGQSGIEVRNTDVDVNAIGRVATRSEMPVAGWDSRFSSVNVTLNLPPGHKLLTAPGVDRAAGSWMSQWQLLDFFMVLIITIGVWRMFGPAAGVVALGALALTFHEAGAPAWLWLNLLIAMALLRVAPAGRLRQVVSGYQSLSALALLIALVPFLAGQIRSAVYPQLEPQDSTSGLFHLGARMEAPDDQVLRFERPAESAARESMIRATDSEGDMLEEIIVFSKSSNARQSFSRYAANAIVQAGPGIPSWGWNSHRLSWSGPVDPDQTMRLVIMPRWLVSALRFLAAGFALLLAGILAAEMFGRRLRLPGGFELVKGASTVAAVAIIGSSLVVGQSAHAQVPDQEILEELEQRLLEPPNCVPRCAEISSADVRVSADAIEIRLDIHALENVGIPLPGSLAGWRPDTVLLENAGRARLVRAPNGNLWLNASAGRQQVTMRGPIPAVDTLELSFPTPARVVSVDADGWFVAGIQDRRLTSGSLQLTRLRSESDGDGAARWESSRFPAFVTVHRSVDLDLDWRVYTEIERIAPAQGALTLEIPLLDGETVVSGEFTVEDGKVIVSMNPQEDSVSWASNLPLTSPLTLTTSDGSSWTEVWRFSTGNVWNAQFDGIPESNMDTYAEGVRSAVFHPRNGESLTVTTTRPEASDGTTLAFDNVRTTVAEGQRSRAVNMTLSYRSTRGAQHSIGLPATAEVTSVTIDDEEQTLRAVGGTLTIPILPGEHVVNVEWREDGVGRFISKTPLVELGAPASNIETVMTLSRDRWLLATTGPQLGPAVLYWSELLALVVFTFVLGKIKLTPLTQKHWLLLGLGFSTFNWFVLILVAAWLIVCGFRQNWDGDAPWWRYNLVQIAIAGFSVVALYNIVVALPAGLLGTPDMHVTGNGSYGGTLKWFADRTDSVLPLSSAVSVPLWIYKALILAWALWFSFALLRWLPWVWKCLNAGDLWRTNKPVESGGSINT